jgi:predicted phosphodiesterase
MTRLAVISDIHSNLQALTAVWARMDELSIDSIYCLGDVVGYGARPAECLAMIRENNVRTVQGNHDALVADGSLRLDFNIYSLAAVEHNRQQLKEDDLNWLGALPTFLQPEKGALFAHGSPDDRDRYLIYLDDLQEASARVLESDGPGVCFFGHTHHPVVFDGQGFIPIRQKKIFLEKSLRMLVNPGSVGQPRDSDPRASFLWWDRREGSLNFERVEYDNLAARRDILEAGLPRVLGDRLIEGR